MWCLSRRKSGDLHVAYVGSSYPCPLCSWNAREGTPQSLSLFHVDPSVCGITREGWRSVMLTVPVYPDSPSVLTNITPMEATAAFPWACIWTPRTLQYHSLTSICSMLFLILREAGTGFRDLSTQVFTQARFFKQMCMVNRGLRKDPPRSTPTAELIWTVVCENMRTLSMHFKLLLSLWRAVSGIHWPVVQKPSAITSAPMETWLWTIWVAEVSCGDLNCGIVTALAIF